MVGENAGEEKKIGSKAYGDLFRRFQKEAIAKLELDRADVALPFNSKWVIRSKSRTSVDIYCCEEVSSVAGLITRLGHFLAMYSPLLPQLWSCPSVTFGCFKRIMQPVVVFWPSKDIWRG